MNMLLVYLILPSALSSDATVIIGGEACSTTNGHPENGGYFVMGVNGYKSIMADEDPDDPSTYGDHGQKADDTNWTKLLSYPQGTPKSCTPYPRYGPAYMCLGLTDNFHFKAVETCAIMRFGFAADSGSTVYQMADNATFQACDFTGATQVSSGGDNADGSKYLEFIFDHDALDKQYFFASQDGCDEGQKIAVVVTEAYMETYEECYKEGQASNRIQHCDCDHSVSTRGQSNEVCHTAYVEGCKSQMPDDLSCCPGADATASCDRYGRCSYVNGGNCIAKSDLDEKMTIAKQTYEMCTDSANAAQCDEFKTGDCPWWRVYNMGGWVYNTDKDGTEGCVCHDTYSEDHSAPICTAMGGCENCAAITPRYNGRSNRLNIEDIPANYGCDGANSTYTPHCDQWYIIANCMDLESGALNLAGYSNATKDMMLAEVTAASCSQHQGYAAYKMYKASCDSGQCWTRGPTPSPTPLPTAVPTPPTPAPTAVPTTLSPTAPTAVPIEETTAEPAKSTQTTAEPAESTEPTTKVSGALSFSMDSAAATSVAAKFSDASTKAEVSAAFSKTIAASLDGVDEEHVEITGITASRRLGMARALQSGSLAVDYTITAPADVVNAATTNMAAIDTAAFSTSLTTELQKVDGLSTVTVASMDAPEAPTATAAPTTAAATSAAATSAPDETTEAPAETTGEPAAIEVSSQSGRSLLSFAAIGLALAVLQA